jgi:hypothetical protein
VAAGVRVGEIDERLLDVLRSASRIRARSSGVICLSPISRFCTPQITSAITLSWSVCRPGERGAVEECRAAGISSERVGSSGAGVLGGRVCGFVFGVGGVWGAGTGARGGVAVGCQLLVGPDLMRYGFGTWRTCPGQRVARTVEQIPEEYCYGPHRLSTLGLRQQSRPS